MMKPKNRPRRRSVEQDAPKEKDPLETFESRDGEEARADPPDSVISDRSKDAVND